MWLSRLEIKNFRCIGFAGLAPGAGFNLVCGRNGSGKTSLLEAIYLLCLGRSFRSHRTGDLVRYGQSELMVTGELKQMNGPTVQVGVQKTGKDTQIRFDGHALFNTSELARRLPVVLLTPDSHVDLFSSPKERRRVLDMALFHVKQNYLDIWKRYLRCLKHRNQLLRQGGSVRDIRAWDRQLVSAALWVHREREECVAQLQTILRKLIPDGIGRQLEIRYEAGWDQKIGYDVVLQNGLAGDLSLAYTRFGPHRADIVLTGDGIRIERSFSRGQLKLVTAALMLAQAHYVAEASGVAPLLLVDDLISDLDPEARDMLIQLLADVRSQVFMTMIDSSAIATVPDHQETTLFHVEQGAIQQAA